MGLIAKQDPPGIGLDPPPPNLPPEWTGTPVPSFVDGVGGTYNLATLTTDQENDPLTYTLNGSSAALPTGVTLGSNGVLTGTGSVAEGTTAGIIVDVDDGVNSLVASPSFSIIVAVVITQQELRDLGYLLPEDYGAVGDGVNDDTTALQNCILAAGFQADTATRRRPVWLAADAVYLISDTIRGHSWEYWDALQIVGGKNGARPIIRLKDAATNFGDENNPRPVFVTRAHENTSHPNYPSDPLDNSVPYNTATGNHFGHWYYNWEIDCGNNAGAIGYYGPVAQQAFFGRIKVDATNAYIGIWCIGGANSPGMDIEIIGGKICYYDDLIQGGEACTGTCLAGLKIVADSRTTEVIHFTGFVPLTVVGFDITWPNAGPAIVLANGDAGYNTASDGSMVFIDGIFRLTGGGSIMDNTATHANGGRRCQYFRNVYQTGSDDIIQSGDNSMVTAIGQWKRINEYNYNNPTSTDASKGWYKCHRMIDGVVDQVEETIDVDADVSAPVVDYIARHVIDIPLVDTGPFVNIEDHGAQSVETLLGDPGLNTKDGVHYFSNEYSPPLDEQSIDNTTPITDAIAAAKAAGHNTVVVPRGSYGIGSEILLDKDTIFIGVHHWRSELFPIASWRPTSNAFMMQTADDATGTCHVSSCGMTTREMDGSFTSPTGPWQYGWFSWVNWRTGKSSSSVMPHRRREWVPPSYFINHPRYYYSFEGNAGGKHYALVHHDGRNFGGVTARQILISGTSAPMHLYGCAVESNKAGSPMIEYNIERKNSSNVRLYSSKREGHAPTLGVFNSTNIAMYGLGRQQEGDPEINGVAIDAVVIVRGTSNNILVAPILRDFQSEDPDSSKNFVYEDVGTIKKSPDYPQMISLYKLGTLDDGAATI